MNEQKNTFEYTYSARDKAEIMAIRDKYIARAETDDDKMARLRTLDTNVTRKASVVSLVFGIMGLMILGFGMSLLLSELSDNLGLSRSVAMPLGISVGVVGMALVALAYPVYVWTINRERKRIAPEILKLTNELMK